MARARYSADLTAGSLKVRESRIIADLLLRGLEPSEWRSALYGQNALQTRATTSTERLAGLIRGRLQTMDSGLWKLVRDGSAAVATHACLAATVKRSPLLGDFLDIEVREQHRVFSPSLSNSTWQHYVEGCYARDPAMPVWRQSTVERLRSSVFQILAQAGYLESTRTLRLQTNHMAKEVLGYLEGRGEHYVLRCIQVNP